MTDLNEARRVYNNKHKILTQSEVEISKLKKTNQELKVMLLQYLIEKEELKSQKLNLESNIEKNEQQIEELERETDMMMLNSS